MSTSKIQEDDYPKVFEVAKGCPYIKCTRHATGCDAGRMFFHGPNQWDIGQEVFVPDLVMGVGAAGAISLGTEGHNIGDAGWVECTSFDPIKEGKI